MEVSVKVCVDYQRASISSVYVATYIVLSRRWRAAQMLANFWRGGRPVPNMGDLARIRPYLVSLIPWISGSRTRVLHDRNARNQSYIIVITCILATIVRCL